MLGKNNRKKKLVIILCKRRLHLRYLSQCQHLIQGNGCLPHPKHLRDHLLLASQVGHPLAYMQFKLQKWWEVEHIMGTVQEIQSNRLPVDMCSARKNLILKLLRRTNCSKAHTNKKMISVTEGKHSFHIARLWYFNSHFFSLEVIAPNTFVSPTINAKENSLCKK